MPMDNVTLENTQQSISSRDAKSVASVMVNGKWVNLSDTLEQANVKSDVGTVSKQVAEQQTVITSAVAQADSAVAYANDAIEKSRVNSQAIEDINSAVSDAVSDAAVARSDGLRAWNAAQSNVDLIDQNYASASAAISSARTEAIAAADEAKKSASAAQADIVAVRSDVAAVQADVTANKSDIAVAKNDIAVVKTDLASQATSLSSYAAQASAAGKDITVLKSQAGQLEQDMADTKGDVSQLKVSASSASVALSDAAGNISSLQASAKSYSAALSDVKGDIATVTATASELETKYADAAGDINKLQTDAKGTTQTLADAQGDIAKLKTRADGFDTEFANANGDISKLQTDASGTKQTLTNAKSDIAVLQSRADGFDTKYADVAGNINKLQVDTSGMKQTLTDAQGNISTLQATATGFKNTLTDAQGNISTLQSDVAGLKKTTSDHAGNIATLQADAKTLTSQMSSAQGDISTLKQTASGFSSKVSGMETSLANANNKLDGITSNGGGRNLAVGTSTDWVTVPDVNQWNIATIATYSNAKAGDVFTISVDTQSTKPMAYQIWQGNSPGVRSGFVTSDNRIASGTTHSHTTFTWPAGATQYLIVQLALNAPDGSHTSYKYKNAMLEKGIVAHDWSPAPEDTNAKITTNTTAIEQNKKAITLKADQTTVDKTNGNVQLLQSQLKIQEGQINAKVSSSDLDAKLNDLQIGGQNLLKDTDKMTDANYWGLRGAKLSKAWYGAVEEGLALSSYNLQCVSSAPYIDYIPQIAFEQGTDYTVSFWTTAVDAPALYLNADDSAPNTSHEHTNSQQNISLQASGRTCNGWKQVTATFKPTVATAYLTFFVSTAWVSSFKLEKGNKTTPWSPAPADAQTYTQTQIKQTADAWNANLTSVKNGLTQSYTNLHATVDGIQAQVYNKDGSSRITQLSNLIATKVSSGDYNSQITQLKNDINLRVKQGNVVSQINQEAGGNTLIQVANGQGKLALNASSVVFSGSAFIPDAYITTLNADKLRFYDSSGNVATMSAGLEQYDDDKTKRSIVLKYSGGYEVHASDLLGSILTMHDNTIRLAVKANGNAPETESKDQYSGFYAMSHYAQLSCYRSNGSAPGIFITDDSYTIKGDDSGNGTKYGDLYIVSPQVHVRGSNAAQMQVNKTHAWLSDGMLHLYKDGDSSTTATKLQVDGWAWVNGFVEAAGHSQHSALSTKTEIQPVDDDKMLKMVNDTDLATFLYKTDVANGETHRHIGLIIDDVHDVAQYQTPQEFIAPNGVSRDDDNMIGALFGAVKALTKRIKTLESKVG